MGGVRRGGGGGQGEQERKFLVAEYVQVHVCMCVHVCVCQKSICRRMVVLACGCEREHACGEHRSKPLCITQGVINLIISKTPSLFHEGRAPGCGLEHSCSRFQ